MSSKTSKSGKTENETKKCKYDKKHHKHHKHSCSSSSSSSSSDSEIEKYCDSDSIDSEILKLKQNRKVNKKIECLEEKIIENKIKDKHVEEKIEHKIDFQIDKIKHKIKNNDEKYKKIFLRYKKIIHRLRREKCLMVNGSDAYGSFYCTTPQTILPNDYIVFEKYTNILNLSFEENQKEVKISIPGIYTFNITAQFDQPCQVAIFINDLPDLEFICI